MGFSSTSKATGAPGYSAGSIGVSSGNKTSGTACGQVNTDATEALSLALNPTNVATVFGPAKADSATLDIEVKSDARIRADLFDGTSLVGTYELQSGSSIDAITSTGPTPIFKCRKQSDSGPDSGSNDNCTWFINNNVPASDGTDRGRLGADFTKIMLTPSSASSPSRVAATGSVPAANRSVLHLESMAEGTLDCDNANVASQLGNGGVITGVDVTRLDNGDGATGTALPYTPRCDLPATWPPFHKPLTTLQEAAQFAIAVSRHFGTRSNPVPAAQVDWEDGTGAHDLAFCRTGVVTAIGGGPDYLPTVDWNLANTGTGFDQSPSKTLVAVRVHLQAGFGPRHHRRLGGSVDWVYFTGDIKFPSP